MYDLCLIGLGNPGSKYDQTKHNVGKDWLIKLADSYSLIFEEKKRYEASITSSHQNKWKKSVYETYKENEISLKWTEDLASTCKKFDIEYPSDHISNFLRC